MAQHTAKSKDEAQYAPSAAQLDLEARRANGNESPRAIGHVRGNPDDGGRDYGRTGEELDGYVGTDPMYQNYADDTHKPLQGDGVEDEVADQFAAETESDRAWYGVEAADEDAEGDTPPSSPSTPSSASGSDS